MPEYSIKFHDTVCGVADVRTEGLYYCVSCRCKRADGMYQIIASGDQGTVNLGTCVRVEGGVGLQTKVARKKLGKIEGFEKINKYEKEKNWIPLIDGSPIKTLTVIAQAKLVKKGNETGLQSVI